MRIQHLLETASTDFDPTEPDAEHPLRITRAAITRASDLMAKMQVLQKNGIIGLSQFAATDGDGKTLPSKDWISIPNYARNAEVYVGPDEDEEHRKNALLAIKLDKQLGVAKAHILNAEKYGNIGDVERNNVLMHLQQHIQRMKTEANNIMRKYQWTGDKRNPKEFLTDLTSGQITFDEWQKVFHYQAFQIFARNDMATEPPVVQLRKLDKQIQAVVRKMADL